MLFEAADENRSHLPGTTMIRRRSWISTPSSANCLKHTQTFGRDPFTNSAMLRWPKRRLMIVPRASGTPNFSAISSSATAIRSKRGWSARAECYTEAGGERG